MIRKNKHILSLLVGILAAVFVLLNISACTENGAAPETLQETETVDLAGIPQFSGSPYVTLNNNVPGFTEADYTTVSFETYSEFDSLGRCGTAYANIGTDLMPAEERGAIGQIKPTGWHTIKYNGIVDGNYLFNRCHLIGYQLTGENSNAQNLITGTRYLNVEGMLPFENMVADYIKETGNHVLYRVTPVFEGDNLLASGVLMEALSVEDQGKGIKFYVYCYNAQPGIGIDYATGDSWLAEEESTVSSEKPDTKDKSVAEKEPVDSHGRTYVLNTNTKRFHSVTCPSVSQMKDKNKREFTGTREEAIAQGYEPCENCNP